MGLALVLSSALAVLPAGSAPARPDLVVRAISNPPPVVQIGQRFRISETVLNRGGARAPRSRTIHYLSADTKVSRDDQRLPVTHVVGRLRSGARTRAGVDLQALTVAAGPRYVIACADGRHRIRERRERNNCRVSRGTVRVIAAPGPSPRGPNAAPTLVTASTPLGYTEGTGEQRVDRFISVADPDSRLLRGATVQITGNHVGAEDQLTFAPANGITATYDDAAGKLTLTGAASPSSYRHALGSVTYSNSSDDPSIADRTVTFRVTDGDRESAPASRTILVDAPVITPSGSWPTVSSGDGVRTTIDSGLTVEDGDDLVLTGAVVRVSGNFQPGDLIIFEDQLGISGAYDATNGVLQLTGDAYVWDYNTALSGVAFRTTADPPASPKTIEFRASDGARQGAPAEVPMIVTRP